MADASTYALYTEQLSVNYEKTPVLWDINLQIPKQRLVGIIGPNGAGKSSLIKAILQIIPTLSGKVLFGGNTLDLVRKQIAYVPQRGSVDWNFPITVRELVMMGRYGQLGIGKRVRASDRQAVDNYLELVGLTAFADRQISQLSGGQQQRAFLARALVQEADIYFLDEPFIGIDMATENTLITLLQQLRDQGKTIFIVHHDLSTVNRYFDWVVILNMRLIASGPIDTAFTPEAVHIAYGRNSALFDEVSRLCQQQRSGKIG